MAVRGKTITVLCRRVWGGRAGTIQADQKRRVRRAGLARCRRARRAARTIHHRRIDPVRCAVIPRVTACRIRRCCVHQAIAVRGSTCIDRAVKAGIANSGIDLGSGTFVLAFSAYGFPHSIDAASMNFEIFIVDNCSFRARFIGAIASITCCCSRKGAVCPRGPWCE